MFEEAPPLCQIKKEALRKLKNIDNAMHCNVKLEDVRSR